MPKGQSLERFLDRAKKKEKRYDWARAVDLYEQALGAVGKKDFLRKGEVQERIGYCFHRAAFQAENKEEFKERMRQAVRAYDKAQGFHEKLADELKEARISRCRAIAKYLGYWLTFDPSEKRKLLDECLELEGKALAFFAESGDKLEYGSAYNELPLVFWFRFDLEWKRQTRESIAKQGLEWGEKAVAALYDLGDSYGLAKAFFTLADCLGYSTVFTAEPEKQEQYTSKVVKYLNKAVDLSEKVGDAHLLGLSHLWLGFNTGGEESVKHYEKALECSRRTRDNLLIAWSLVSLAETAYRETDAVEDPEKRRELAEKAMQLYQKGQHRYSTISFITYTHGLMAGHYLRLATWETDIETRLEFLKKAEKEGMEALKLAQDSDVPKDIVKVLHTVSKTLEARARIEPDPSTKRSRLERALKHREKAIEISGEIWPFLHWHRADMQNHLGGIKAELADVVLELDTKRKLLEEAVSNKEKCLRLINKQMPYLEELGETWAFAKLHGYQDSYATLLTRLYNLTNNPELLRRAIEISQKAIESTSKLNLVSLMAESYWKIARAQNILGDYMKAAENFEHASENYKKAAEKIPQLKGFYQDYAFYMQAWNDIKKAKHHHAEEQYDQAKEHYQKAADLHRSAERWSHLSQNYSAWARLEEAEDLSRREQTEEAKNIFQQAAKLFAEAKKSIKAKLEEIKPRDEKEMAAKLVEASDIRREYCLGRIDLEEAKILDRQGNHNASSKRYGCAAARFQKAAEATEHESDRQELRPIVYLCRAWQTMTQAEAEASPDLYLEASRFFDETKEHSLDEKGKVLALGHSRFCKALEAGMRFEDTRDTTIYLAAKKHIEAATSYYLKAGFKTASEYAKATYRLFDAYMFTYKAQMETEPEKKAQFYQMAERLLEASAGSYMKAKHPEKGEDIRRLLESVREERQLAVSLAEVLHAPLIASTTASFSTPNPIYEKAVGLETFEHAHVQANLFIPISEVKVGEDVALEIELVNAGKGPATLVKIEGIVPTTGFNVKEKPKMYRVEDSCLNLKGKRLDPLKSEEMKVVVKPISKGVFVVNPRVLYTDETGNYKSHEPKPVTITVKELGIKGWIKGER